MEFELECISGAMKGKRWTCREGVEYKLGRGRDADIRTPNDDMSIARDNTVLFSRDGIPYVGTHRTHEEEAVGTWLNNSYLSERAEKGQKQGWHILHNQDTISIGRGEETLVFRVTCETPRTMTMEERYRQLEMALRNPVVQQPQDILKNPRKIDMEPLKRQLAQTMQEKYRQNLSMIMDGNDRMQMWNPLPDKEAEDDMQRLAEQREDWFDKRYSFTPIRDSRSEIRAWSFQENMDHMKQQYGLTDCSGERKNFLKQITPFHVEENLPHSEQNDYKESDLRQKALYSREETASEKDYKTNFSFRTVKKIGEGGFSHIFLIEDERDGEQLVLKSLDVIKEMTSIQEAKYLREADIGQRLRHRNLVKTYDIRKVRGNYYMIMEYCDGGSLAQKMKESYGYLDLEDATEYFLQVLDGLDYLHNVTLEQPDKNDVMRTVTGIVHRDIKPDNMLIKLVDGKEVVKISDFGLSKSYELAGFSGITQGEGAGSLKYCSKRQFSGNYQFVGPQDDIFSAAASYYEMITGKCVRGQASMKTIPMDILAGKLVPVQKANPHIPGALAEVIDSVLQEEQLGSNGTFTTAKELKENIKNALGIRE